MPASGGARAKPRRREREEQQAGPRLCLPDGVHVGVVDAIDDEGVWPEEEADVIEVGGPFGHEVASTGSSSPGGPR